MIIAVHAVSILNGLRILPCGIRRLSIDYTQRLSIQWITKAFRDQAQGVIYGGDMNATWTADEPGGCYVLSNWANEHDLINGPRQIADHRNERFHTHHSGSWIDHILHAGPLGQIDILAAFVGWLPLVAPPCVVCVSLDGAHDGVCRVMGGGRAQEDS